MVDQFTGALRRNRSIRRVRHVAQQTQIAVELFSQLLTGQRALAGGQQRGTAQVHGIGRACIVNAYHQIGGNVIHRRRQPGWADGLDRIDRFTPLRYMLVEVSHQWHRFAKVDIPLTQITQLAQATQHLRQTLFLFRRATQLFRVRAHFHYVLVADVDGYEGNRTRTAAQHRLNGHRQRAGFRVEQTPGT